MKKLLVIVTTIISLFFTSSASYAELSQKEKDFLIKFQKEAGQIVQELKEENAKIKNGLYDVLVVFIEIIPSDQVEEIEAMVLEITKENKIALNEIEKQLKKLPKKNIDSWLNEINTKMIGVIHSQESILVLYTAHSKNALNAIKEFKYWYHHRYDTKAA